MHDLVGIGAVANDAQDQVVHELNVMIVELLKGGELAPGHLVDHQGHRRGDRYHAPTPPGYGPCSRWQGFPSIDSGCPVAIHVVHARLIPPIVARDRGLRLAFLAYVFLVGQRALGEPVTLPASWSRRDGFRRGALFAPGQAGESARLPPHPRGGTMRSKHL